jgi:hypothetical protein
MAEITIQTGTRAGITPTFQAVAAGGDEYANDGTPWCVVWNDHAADPRTVTIVTQRVIDGTLAVADRAVTILAANDVAYLGPFGATDYNDGDGMVQLTYSDSGADMRIGVFKLTTA